MEGRRKAGHDDWEAGRTEIRFSFAPQSAQRPYSVTIRPSTFGAISFFAAI